jgi:multiple sugar transport system permease protein
VALPTVTGTILISAMAGTALALYRLRLGVPLFAMFVAGNLVPFQILMIPVRNLMVRLGVYDTYGSLILFHIAFQTGFCTLFMRNFIGRLPFELVEAARLAGAGELRIFWSIVLPLVRPAMAALAVLVFTFVWNDYFWALTLVQSDSVRPVTTGLTALRGQWVTSWQLVSAGSLLAALPPVVVFLLMQNHFVSGLTAGARRR